MKMPRYLLSLCIIGTSLYASLSSKEIAICGPSDYQEVSTKTDKERSWYGIIGTGYAWSQEAGIHNPNTSQWDDSSNGYDSTLGSSQFFTFGFGKQLSTYFFLDMTYSYFQTFHYMKAQIGSDSGASDFGFTRRIRFFDLDNQNILFNLSIYQKKYFSWHALSMTFSPFIGGGIGVGLNRVSNFYTVTATGTTTSIGRRYNKNSFAWQVMGGLRLRPVNSSISIDLGYHYYVGGGFKCPSKIYVENSSFLGAPVNATSWEGTLKTHQLSGTFNIPF
jgi:opacity protein-like surface antigen